MIKTFLIILASKFKSFPYFGRARFWILYWSYKITGWHIRAKEWDFVLEYLPKIIKEQDKEEPSPYPPILKAIKEVYVHRVENRY